MQTQVQLITPCLWFDRNAEEAANFYTGIFPNSGMDEIARYGKAGFEIHGMPEGMVLTVKFTLAGQPFMALNGGPLFQFNEAISFQVSCGTQEELDHYWQKLGEGGDPEAQVCGWLKDRYGVSWQITPRVLGQMLVDPDIARRERVMTALHQMRTLDIAGLQRAFDGS
ncbi:MAG: VOC family protein [Candidatus Hydrogenedentes bacterium]|nr:VOC family protein [Candidatus Hydrogenedentota bacterium]